LMCACVLGSCCCCCCMTAGLVCRLCLLEATCEGLTASEAAAGASTAAAAGPTAVTPDTVLLGAAAALFCVPDVPCCAVLSCA
jgi:hypothetical protein